MHDPVISNRGARWRWMVYITFRQLYSRERTLVPN